MRYKRAQTRTRTLQQEKAFVNRSEQPGWLRVVTPYNEGFVEELKSTIPYSFRRWVPEAKHWEVKDDYLEDLLNLMVRYYGDNIESNILSGVVSDTNPYSVLGLLPNAEPEVVTSAYRSLAKKHHPDKGGSEQMMQKINDAYMKIRKERAEKEEKKEEDEWNLK